MRVPIYPYDNQPRQRGEKNCFGKSKIRRKKTFHFQRQQMRPRTKYRVPFLYKVPYSILVKTTHIGCGYQSTAPPAAVACDEACLEGHQQKSWCTNKVFLSCFVVEVFANLQPQLFFNGGEQTAGAAAGVCRKRRSTLCCGPYVGLYFSPSRVREIRASCLGSARVGIHRAVKMGLKEEVQPVGEEVMLACRQVEFSAARLASATAP